MASPFLRWAITFSLIAIALAFALRQQVPLTSSSSSSSPLSPTTHCYKSVLTNTNNSAIISNEANPSPKCFTVTDGHFSSIFTPENDIIPSDAVLEDGHVIPGLWDGHGHLRQYGEFLHSVDLFGSKSLEEVRIRIKKYLAENPGVGGRDEWVRGIGWDQTFFGRMPTADDLAEDPELKDLHIMLDRIDVHCSWVSNSILSLIPPHPPTIPGGEIVTNPGPGVFCDNAMDLVFPLLPKPSKEKQIQQVRSAMAALNAVGIVGMHDAGETRRNVETYREMAEGKGQDGKRDDGWTVRVYGMMECEARNTFCPEEVASVAGEGDFLSVKSIKLFADGALGSWGSALLEPYTDNPSTSGSLLISAPSLSNITSLWAQSGYQVNIHAIGDLANRNAIDAFTTALQALCPGVKFDTPLPLDLTTCPTTTGIPRFRIEHSQIIHPADQLRIASLPILPSIQPTHATSDMKYALSRLGPDRLATSAYRMGSFARDEIPFILGSDFPVEPPNPFHGIYAAVTRRDPATGLGAPDSPDEGWYMDEALTLDQAIKGFTIGPAWGAFMEGKAGIIREGAYADWVVLDEQLNESVDPESLRSLKVRETWVGGQRVFSQAS